MIRPYEGVGHHLIRRGWGYGLGLGVEDPVRVRVGHAPVFFCSSKTDIRKPEFFQRKNNPRTLA